MTVPTDAHEPAADVAAGGRDRADPGRGRLFVYAICLLISFCLYLFVHGWGQGAIFWLVAALVLAGVMAGIAVDGLARGGRLVRISAILAVTVAIAIPLGPAMISRDSLAMAGSAVWPQILVALFGSRVIAEVTELQFTELWRDPFSARQAAPVQSLAAALALGACLTLLFYWAGAQFGGARGSVSGVVVAALLGDTIIHRTIIFLFFTILAFAVDAALLYVKDRSAVRALRMLSQERGGIGGADLRRLLDRDLAPWAHTRAVRFIRDSLDAAAGGIPSPAASAALAGFHQASRRFVRGLVPFLPLLGFLGTVIGLTIALGALPHGLGGGQRETFDIGGSLAGLAVQFETTLIGLLGSIVASLALGLLEKAEAELAAECSLLVDAAETRARQNAV